MSDARDVRALVQAAEEAAAAGNYAEADALLSQALARQEADLGALHPDVANTLNNLAIVAEGAGRTDEAERAYRRAYAVARDTLEPDHPFVLTSESNLREFCAAHGRDFDLLAPDEFRPEARLPRARPAAGAPDGSRPRLRILLAASVAIGLAVVWWVVARDAPAPAPGAGAMSSAAAVSEPPPEAAPAVPEAPPVAPAVPAGEAAKPAVVSGPPAAPAPAEAASLSVVRAALCRSFSTATTADGDWRCDEAGASVPPGVLTFYTRVRSARAATIHHRWYLGERLVQQVPLRIAANPGAGYRTYSRMTVAAGRAGDWRVELRSGDTLLHETRVAVR